MKEQGNIRDRVRYYADLPYTTAVHAEKQPDGTNGFAARVVELPDCRATGATPEEAVRRMETMKTACIEHLLAEGKHVPVPLRTRNLSGKFQVRISPSLHEAIALRAELDGISLNSYVSAALWRVVGQEESLEILVKDSSAGTGEPALRIRTKK